MTKFPTDKQLHKWGAKAHKDIPKDTSGSLTAYSFVFGDGSSLYTKNYGCHSSLRYGRQVEKTYGKKIVAISNKITRPTFVKGDGEKFYNYLFNRSPWSKCFVTKDVADALENGITVRTDHLDKLVVTACIATRSIWEHPACTLQWVKLVDTYGLSEDVATLLIGSHTLGSTGVLSPRPSSSHEFLYTNSVTDVGCKNFLNHTPPDGPNYVDSMTYSSLDYMWGKSFVPLRINFEVRNTAPEKKSDPFGVVEVNKGNVGAKSSLPLVVAKAFKGIGVDI